MEGYRLDPIFREVEAFVDQRCGHFRAQRGFMTGKMIGMGVGDKSPWFRVPWVQPQVEFRQVQATLETNFNQSAGKLNRDARLGQCKPG